MADNTDVPAIVESLSEAGFSLSGTSVLVLGAGGAARAVCQAVRGEGATVAVAARNSGQSSALASRFGGTSLELGDLDPGGFDLVVNATPLGMWPREEGIPLDPSRLEKGRKRIYRYRSLEPDVSRRLIGE